ncbi:Uncharacterised protein [Salmonella enterica subsp. enterica serovar Bovismorbificans]|uniref:Uncharacterized protein n=1 Tax=Salmonella enterica subsp. enterica serovar Bovismorbificans TaxID=58097 RepID=A0A655BS06_SALET|nr:Uncharacterised protein [Salmonella enterica subsp. enterica serovar Bovismorbificans]
MDIPADHQRIFSLFLTRRRQAERNIVDQDTVKNAEQRLKGGLLAL